MDEQGPDGWKQVSNRVTKLEELFTHLQRAIEDLDQVVQDTQRRLDSLDRRFQLLTRSTASSPGDELDQDLGPGTL